MIEISVKKNIVSVQETEPLISGSVETCRCHFTFDASWNGFGRTAVFKVGSRTVTALLDEENCCILPWELLVRRNIGLPVMVGAYGVSADAAILTSVWDRLGEVRWGSEVGEDAREPSDGVYEQVISALQKCTDKVLVQDETLSGLTARSERAAELAVMRAEDAARYAANMAKGIYNVVLKDRSTAEQYALTVENGVLKLLSGAEALEETAVRLTDSVTGIGYVLAVEDGVLLLEEV